MTKPEDEYVFLSYNSQDKEAVEQIATRLKEAGVVPWRDRERLRLGQALDPIIAEALQRSRAVVVVLGPHGLGNYQKHEVRAAAVLHRRNPDRPVLIPLL